MKQYALLFLILVLAGALRAWGLNDKSFWFDEFASVELACGRGYAQYDLPMNQLIPHPPNIIDIDHARPVHEIWFAEKNGHMPPLYSVLLRLWGEVFGLGPMSARGFALIASLGAIVAMFYVMRELSGVSAALWTALVMAVAGAQIQFGQEARAYSLLLLEGLLAAAALVRIEHRGITRGSMALLTVSLLSLTLTHYFSLGAIAALAIYSGVRLSGATRRKVAICFAVAAFGWGVLGAPLAYRHRDNLDEPRSTGFLRDAAPGHLARTLNRAALLPVRFLTEPMTDSKPAATIGAVAFLLAILMPLRRRDLLLWGLWLCLTILPVFLLDVARQTQHLEFTRYTLLASPALYAIIATATLSARSKWVRPLAPALVTLGCLLALQAAYQAWWKADWRPLAEAIDRNHRPGDVIVYYFDPTGWEAYPYSAYLHVSYYRTQPPGPIVLQRGPLDAAMVEQLRQAPGVLVVTYSVAWQPDEFGGARPQWLALEPGAGALWRATWPDDPSKPFHSATTQPTTGPSQHP